MPRQPAAVGKLIVCPTPIGNLDDVTLRVLVALAEADVVACEDTRHARVLLARHRISAPLVSFHEHNERARTRELLERIRRGARVALISDAGTPLIADPGFVLVHACLQSGVEVEVLPGASAVTTALVASGLPADRWCFVGFLPRRRAELQRLLERATDTLVAFESPRRLAGTLELLAAADPARAAAVCRELTKRHEEVSRGSAAELAERFRASPGDRARVRVEVVLIICGAARQRASRDQALLALSELIRAGARARPAAAALAKLTGLGANELYRGLTDRGQ